MHVNRGRDQARSFGAARQAAGGRRERRFCELRRFRRCSAARRARHGAGIQAFRTASAPGHGSRATPRRGSAALPSSGGDRRHARQPRPRPGAAVRRDARAGARGGININAAEAAGACRGALRDCDQRPIRIPPHLSLSPFRCPALHSSCEQQKPGYIGSGTTVQRETKRWRPVEEAGPHLYRQMDAQDLVVHLRRGLIGMGSCAVT